jgi:hypothetical protein
VDNGGAQWREEFAWYCLEEEEKWTFVPNRKDKQHTSYADMVKRSRHLSGANRTPIGGNSHRPSVFQRIAWPDRSANRGGGVIDHQRQPSHRLKLPHNRYSNFCSSNHQSNCGFPCQIHGQRFLAASQTTMNKDQTTKNKDHGRNQGAKKARSVDPVHDQRPGAFQNSNSQAKGKSPTNESSLACQTCSRDGLVCCK